MSYIATSWAWSLTELGLADSMILISLADQANDEGICWPSQATLAARCRQSERSVRRGLARLQAAGLIEVTARSGQGGRKSNRYRLNIGATYSLQDNQPDNLTGCENPVDNPPVENSPVDNVKAPELGLFVANKATGQSGRLRKRTDCPVAQPDTGDRSQPDTAGRLQYRGKNHQEEPPDQTPQGAPASRDGQVGSGQGETHARMVELGVGDGEAGRLIAACLPGWMHAMDAPGAARVARLLTERIQAGWTPAQIATLMDAPPPPEGAVRLSALVAYRLEANVIPALAPARLSRPSVDAQAQADAERAQRAEALAAPGPPRRTDPAWDQALAAARAAMPGASWPQIITAAQQALTPDPATRPAAHPGRPGRCRAARAG